MTEADRALLLSLSAPSLLALTMYGEARGESVEARIGVGCVVRNRVRTQYRGASYHGVCLERLQFSCWNDDDPNQAVLTTIARDLTRHITQAEDFRETLFLAEGIVGDQLRDLTRGARHYHDVSVRPSWAREDRRVLRLGRLIFYVGIA